MTEIAARNTTTEAATPPEAKKGSLRGVMPQTADAVDMARKVMGEVMGIEEGRAYVDDIVRRAIKGGGGFYAAEIGPDGKLRELGSTRRGDRCVLNGSGQLVWVKGR